MSKNFFADFHELRDVDSKNEKKNFEPKEFFWVQKMPKNAILRLNFSKTGKHFEVRFFSHARGQC